jgi:PHD/YefM family antitoxin component YafN of YafNO toxin-antitoxin module
LRGGRAGGTLWPETNVARQRSTTSAPTDLEAAFQAAAAGKRVKVRRGRKTVVLVPLEDLERLEEADRDDDRALAAVAREALEEYTSSGEAGTPVDEVRPQRLQ